MARLEDEPYPDLSHRRRSAADQPGRARCAGLEDFALIRTGLLGGSFNPAHRGHRKLAAFEVPALAKQTNKLVKGLYCGGTLCSEAKAIFAAEGLKGHSFIDLGDDEYTRGRPHPMIDPEIRNAHIAAGAADPAVGVILVDVVLGYGAHPDPAGVLLKVINKEKPFVASVTGTDDDPQVRSRQVSKLRDAGVLVAPSNAQAAELAALLVF